MKILLTRCDVGGALLLMLTLLPGCQAAPGTEVAVFASGKPKSEVRLKKADDGRTVRDGWYRSRHENGQTHEEGLYINGKMQGTWTIWDEHGRKRGQQQYREGRRHGRWFAWHANGRLARRWQYREGIMEGVWLTWNEAGILIEELHYKDGILIP